MDEMPLSSDNSSLKLDAVSQMISNLGKKTLFLSYRVKAKVKAVAWSTFGLDTTVPTKQKHFTLVKHRRKKTRMRLPYLMDS